MRTTAYATHEHSRFPRRLFEFSLGTLLVLTVNTPAANHPGFAPCLASNPPTTGPPADNVVVTILSVDPNTDLKGDDDDVDINPT